MQVQKQEARKSHDEINKEILSWSKEHQAMFQANFAFALTELTLNFQRSISDLFNETYEKIETMVFNSQQNQ